MTNAPAITIRRDYRDAAGNWHVTWQINDVGRVLTGEAVHDPALGRTVPGSESPPLARDVLVALKRAVAAEFIGESGSQKGRVQE